MADLATLRSRLDSYVDRNDSDYTSNRDYFINLAIRQLARELNVESNLVELVATQSVGVGTTSFNMPDSLRNTTDTHLTIIKTDGTKAPLDEIPVKFLSREFFDSREDEWVDLANLTTPGTPRFFAIGLLSGVRKIHIRPEPEATMNIEIRGIRYTTDLSAGTDSNYVTLEFEDAVLYLAVAEVWAFFEDSGRYNFWAQKAQPHVIKAKNTRAHEALNNYGGRLQMGTYGYDDDVDIERER